MKTMIIKTQYTTRPPLGSTFTPWVAWADGNEEDGPYGWGATEADAVQDLKDQIEEEKL